MRVDANFYGSVPTPATTVLSHRQERRQARHHPDRTPNRSGTRSLHRRAHDRTDLPRRRGRSDGSLLRRPDGQATGEARRDRQAHLATQPAAGLEVPIFDGALIDRRGSIAAALGLIGDDRMTCAAHFLNGSWYAFGAAVDRGGDPLQPGLMRGWNSDGAEINVVDGFAPDAATIEVDAPDVPTATATVVGGRYIVRLPQSFDWTDSLAGIQIRYLDAAGQILQTIDL